MICGVRLCCSRCGKFQDFRNTGVAEGSGWRVGLTYNLCERCKEIEDRETELHRKERKWLRIHR